MKNIILDTLFFLVAITAHAQLTNWQNISSNNFVMKIIHDQNYLYVGTKGGGIVLNEVTKITLDPLHDLIWLTNHPRPRSLRRPPELPQHSSPFYCHSPYYHNHLRFEWQTNRQSQKGHLHQGREEIFEEIIP